MTGTWWWITSVAAASLALLGWRAAGCWRARQEHDALLARQEALGQQQRDRTACTWPDCLTGAQQQALSDEIGRQMLGEAPTPVTVDQRDVCGCGKAAIMNISKSSKETRA